MEEGSLFQRMKQIFHEDEMDEEMQKEAAGLIRNIFRYMDKDAKDIMTHRKNIVAIDGDWSLEEALQFMLDERFSRFPVYQEDIDDSSERCNVRLSGQVKTAMSGKKSGGIPPSGYIYS